MRDESGNWSSPRLFNFGAEDPGQYAPHRVEVTPGEIAENLAPGVWSGTLNTFDWNDPGGNGSYTYALVSGGVSDNQYFNLQMILTVNQAFDYEQKPFLQEGAIPIIPNFKINNDEYEDGDGLLRHLHQIPRTAMEMVLMMIQGNSGASPSYKYSFPNWAPTITSNGGGATVRLTWRRVRLVTTVVATDSDGKLCTGGW